MLPVHPGRSYFDNLALGKPTKQFSQHKSHASSKAVDGNSNPVLSKGSCAQTAIKLYTGMWWEVDLKNIYTIREVVITATSDPSGTLRIVLSTY